MKKVLKNKTLCLVLGFVFLLAALLFAPIWNFWDSCPWKDWGTKIINILVAAGIICYLAMFLWKKIRGSGKRVIKVLTIVEFTMLSLIALGCILSQFKIFNIQGACKIFGFALWTRGTVELFRAYYYRSDSKEVYPVWYLAISIALVTFGTYCFAKPFIEDIIILWIFVIGLLCLSVLLLACGFSKPAKQKTTKKK